MQTDFFTRNLDIVFGIYSLSFVVMGIVILIQIQKQKDSSFRLSRVIGMKRKLEDNSGEATVAKTYMDSIVESMLDALIVIDPDGRIKTINKATVGLLGYKEEELIGKPVVTILVGEEAALFSGVGMKQLIEKGVIKDYNMAYKAKTGEKIPVSFSGSTLRGKGGELVGIVGVAHDMREIERLVKKEKELAVTKTRMDFIIARAAEMEKAYKNLKEMQDMLIQAEKMNAVGRLASGIAHEVKNPLGIIKQGADYLEGKLSSSPEKNVSEILGIIKDNIKRADDIVNTLVDFSRAKKLEKKPEDINFILESSLILIQHRATLENIKITRKLGKNLPNVSVDKSKMEQVFINIFLNAIQAMPGGGNLFLRTYQARLNESKSSTDRRGEDYFAAGEEALIIEIEDTGVGIPEENLKKVFDPFFTTKEPGQGTGLGLSVTENILTMHKGLIEIRSREGKGTKVIITLEISDGGKDG